MCRLALSSRISQSLIMRCDERCARERENLKFFSLRNISYLCVSSFDMQNNYNSIWYDDSAPSHLFFLHDNLPNNLSQTFVGVKSHDSLGIKSRRFWQQWRRSTAKCRWSKKKTALKGIFDVKLSKIVNLLMTICLTQKFSLVLSLSAPPEAFGKLYPI